MNINISTRLLPSVIQANLNFLIWCPPSFFICSDNDAIKKVFFPDSRQESSFFVIETHTLISAHFPEYLRRSVTVETEEKDSSAKIGSLLEKTPKTTSDPEKETSPSVFFTSREVARQIRAATDLLTQQLTHFCELIQELKDEHTHRHQEGTTSSIAASSPTGVSGRSDIVTGPQNSAFAPLSTLAPSDRLTSPELPPHHRGFSFVDENVRPAENPSTKMNQVISAINCLLAILRRDFTQTKVLHTQIPKFRMSKVSSVILNTYYSNHLRHFSTR